jgi:hypothetical protein
MERAGGPGGALGVHGLKNGVLKNAVENMAAMLSMHSGSLASSSSSSFSSSPHSKMHSNALYASQSSPSLPTLATSKDLSESSSSGVGLGLYRGDGRAVVGGRRVGNGIGREESGKRYSEGSAVAMGGENGVGGMGLGKEKIGGVEKVGGGGSGGSESDWRLVEGVYEFSEE